LIDPQYFIPEGKLASLFDEIKQVWVDSCRYHNTDVSLSLLSPHSCTRENVPSQVLRDIQGGTHEIWRVEFSPNGKYLAAGSADGVTHIYQVNGDREFALDSLGDTSGVSSVAW